MRLIARLAWWLAWIASLPAWAAQPDAPLQDCPPYLVVFSNGVRTTQAAAEFNLAQLNAALPASRRAYRIDFALAWARSGSSPTETTLLRDLVESFGQKVAPIVATGWSGFMRYFATLDTPLPDGHAVKNDMLAAGLQSLVATTSHVASALLGDAASEATADLEHHLSDVYKPALLAGKRVVVVAHSQGNFYANEAYRRLAADPEIGAHPRLAIVSVANPSNWVGGDATNASYVTSPNDLVIGAVATVTFDSVLPPRPVQTMSVAELAVQVSVDPIGHGFGEIYLNQLLPFRAEVLRLIDKAFDDLPQNCFMVDIESRGTYLAAFAHEGQSLAPVTIISLASLNASPDARLGMRIVGSFDYIAGQSSGGQATTAVFLDTDFAVVPPGGVNPSPIETQPACTIPPDPPIPTDILQDFGIGSVGDLVVTVPANGGYMAFSPYDCYFPDNAVPDRYGARIVVYPPSR